MILGGPPPQGVGGGGYGWVVPRAGHWQVPNRVPEPPDLLRKGRNGPSDGLWAWNWVLELERNSQLRPGKDTREGAWPGTTPTGRGRPVLQLQMIDPPNIPLRLPAITRMDIILDGLKPNNIYSKNTYYFSQRSLQGGR